MEKHKEKYTLKNVNKQQVISYIAPVVICKGLFGYRWVGLESLFDTIQLDDNYHYSFKLNLSNTKWYHDITLSKVYKYNSIYMSFTFNSEELPKRCKDYHLKLTEDFYQHLKSSGNRVSKSKIRLVTKHLIKHISRLKYHKKYAIRYARNPKYWKLYNKNLSWTYMDKLIDYLRDLGHLHNFVGSKTSSEGDVCSMLVVNPSFIDQCVNVGYKEPVVVESCLVPERSPLIEIRDKNKKPRKPNRKELIEMSSMEAVAEEYCKLLSERSVSINGIEVPELFFRRIASVDLNHGCRWYDDGSIQREDATSRSSVTIDGEPTVEVDYSSLHYSLAAEELGLNLKGKDPYNFPFFVEVDNSKIDQWREDYGFSKEYNPVRNLKKVALLTMFNAKSVEGAVSAISKALRDDYNREELVKRKFVGITKVRVKELVASLKEHNKEVDSYLNSGVGLRFQKLDSEMITYCIQRFLEKGEVCIPIHDSLIVKESMKEFAKRCMEDAYENVMGSKVNCKIK